MVVTYGDVHGLLLRERGSARNYVCVGCGQPAKDWAYQHNGDPEYRDERGRAPYAEDIYGCYSPMCAKCHKILDLEREPEVAEARRALGRKVGSLRTPQSQKAARENAILARQAIQERLTPERREEIGAYKVHRQSTRPEVSVVRANAAKVANSKRRRCLDCGRVSTPAGLGRHLKSSDHSGYEDLIE